MRGFIWGGGAPPNMVMCDYSTVCDEADCDGENVYKCGRVAVGEGTYCELHDDSYLADGDEGAVFKALMEEVANSHRLVGFHLPAIAFAANVSVGTLYFEKCQFHGMVDFSGLHIKSPLTFINCNFETGANFTRSTFDHLVRFKTIVSGHDARFDFGRSNFAEIYLIGSEISQADFSFVKFSRAKFLGDTFRENVSLNDTEFHDCDFVDIIFQKELKFIASKFSRCVFKNLNFKTATFKSSIFDPNGLSVMEIDMSNVSLLDVDLSGVKFSDHTKWDDDHSYNIYDLRMFYSNPTPDRFAGTLGVLRSLRDNCEYHLMYRTAGQFFVQEMEMRRNYSLRGKKLSRRPICYRIFSLTGLYFWVCGYGESLRRSGLWLALLFGGSLACFALAAETSRDADAAYASLGMFEKIGLHLKRTMAAFFPLGGGDLPDYTVRVMSIPLLGTLFIVIRRRLERKMRH